MVRQRQARTITDDARQFRCCETMSCIGVHRCLQRHEVEPFTDSRSR